MLQSRFLAGIGAVLCLSACTAGQRDTLAVTGQIEGTYVDVGSRVGGRVETVYFDEGDRVAPGDILLELERDEMEAVRDAAKGQLAQAEAMLEKLLAGAREEQVRQAMAAVTRAEEQYNLVARGFREQEIRAGRANAETLRARRDQARSDYERAANLYEKSAISAQRYEQARHAYEAAEAQYRAAREQANLLETGARDEEVGTARAALEQAQAALDEVLNGARPEDVAAAQAARDIAEADLRRAEVNVREMTITAPSQGVVESMDIYPGDLVKPGPVARIVDPDNLKLVVYVSANVLGLLRVGQPVRLTTDAFGPEEFTGRITQIASQGEFTPRNLQTGEERAQQVFGITIRLDSDGGRLKAGMAATAYFDLRENGAQPVQAEAAT